MKVRKKVIVFFFERKKVLVFFFERNRVIIFIILSESSHEL